MSFLRVTEGADIYKIREEMDALEKALVDVGVRISRFEELTEEGNALFDDDDALQGSSAVTPTPEQRIQKMMKEIIEDIDNFDDDEMAITLKAKMMKANDIWKEAMAENVREMTARMTGITIIPRNVVLNEETFIKAMNSDEIPDVPFAQFFNKPVKPQGISRDLWIECLKMGKKFADAFAEMTNVLTAGHRRVAVADSTIDTMNVVLIWLEANCEKPWMRKLSDLFTYEVLQRVKHRDYFYCSVCSQIQFSVEQFIAHYASKDHENKCHDLCETIDGERKAIFLNATTIFTQLSRVPYMMHDQLMSQFTSAMSLTNNKCPKPDENCYPKDYFLSEIREKYQRTIFEGLEFAETGDPETVDSFAEIIPEIVKRVKGELGIALFKDLNDHFKNGQFFYCYRCLWKLTSIERYYKHLRNPIHVHLLAHKADQVELLTVLVNLHTKNKY